MKLTTLKALATGVALTMFASGGAVAEGAGWHDLSISDGVRQSTADAYLRSARAGRQNLTVWTQARAQRLRFSGNRCVGVELVLEGSSATVRAAREVVVCAGAVDSPRLLLLSGVGPAGELESAGVAVVHDLAGVGRNLHDHPLCPAIYEATRPIPAGRTNHAEVSMLWRSAEAHGGPDMQLMFIHVPFHPPASGSASEQLHLRRCRGAAGPGVDPAGGSGPRHAAVDRSELSG